MNDNETTDGQINPISDAQLSRYKQFLKLSPLKTLHMPPEVLWSFIDRIEAAEKLGADHVRALAVVTDTPSKTIMRLANAAARSRENSHPTDQAGAAETWAILHALGLTVADAAALMKKADEKRDTQ